MIFILSLNYVIKQINHQLMSRSNTTFATSSFLLLFLSTFLITENFLVLGSSTISDTIAKRPDPLRKFKKYGGDYDFKNMHYWASAAFTGLHGYTVGLLWLLTGIGVGSYIVLKKFHGSTPTADHEVDDQRTSSFLLLLLLIVFFSISAMIASGFVIAANEKALRKTKRVEEDVYDAAGKTCETMGKVKTSFIQIETYLQQYDSEISSIFSSMARQMKKESQSIQSFIDEFRQIFDRALETIYVVNLIVVSFTLALLLAGLLLLALHHRPSILVLIFACWIIASLSWIMTGIDFFLNTFVRDTCSTLSDYKKNPDNHGIADMLPCPKLADTEKNLRQIGLFVHTVVDEINMKVTELRQVFSTSKQSDDKSVLDVCDPFGSAPNYTYSPGNCRADSIQVGDLPNVFSRFICFGWDSAKNCTREGRFVPESVYSVAVAYSESIQLLINAYPELASLMECVYVEDAILDIVDQQCKGIKYWAKLLWASMTSLSVLMLVLVLVWCGKAIKDRGRSFNRWYVFPTQTRG